MDPLEVPQGAGSGFLWDKQGHVVTNYHVIKGANELKVTLDNKTEIEARVIGFDPDKDVAVLKIDAPPVRPRPSTWGAQ